CARWNHGSFDVW
nr:immunoglobulin heavy chain junction region [Macaca mulatta]MOW23594.1 immunoglobulin heavy chain junction region [Macaca mulatta]MOW23672.1 immunoglobulin heavy chain junction region [Macaca mulatta]MOW23694.1 immunoglobulin heavy chain junction region [Macaca mulatta]MOW24245.1 immunoglobulin heavy chain junction region [Macaca mulatta]